MSDIKGIHSFKSTYPKLNIQTGIIIYSGQEVYRVAEDIVTVPWDLE